MLKHRLKLYSYHTFLFVPFIVVFLFANNTDQIRFHMTYRTLWMGTLITLALFGLSFLLFRNRLKTGVFVTSLLFILFQYGVVYEFFERMYYAGNWPFHNIHRYLIITYVILIAALMVFLYRSPRKFMRINLFLNVLLCLLIIFNVIKIAGSKVKMQPVLAEVSDDAFKLDVPDSVHRPNVYHIILDGYASNATLKKYFEEDNSKFTSFLKNNGFSLLDSAFANYYYTSESLSATLNMDYHTDTTSSNRGVYDNMLFRLLKKQGYRIYTLFSGYAISNSFRFADSTLKPAILNEFEKSLLKYTIIRLDDLFGFFAHQRLSSQFKLMDQLAVLSREPRYCFLHFVAPHPPFVFDRNGNVRHSRRFGEHSWEPREFYRDQLLFINDKITGLLEKILKHDPNAVIFLQSDHGPWISEHTAEEVFSARSGILYAVHPASKLHIPSFTSPVNTYRYFFNQMLGQDLPILVDSAAGKTELMKDPILNKKVE